MTTAFAVRSVVISHHSRREVWSWFTR